jgi:N6-L-threonylcarbamoyladenine synthase
MEAEGLRTLTVCGGVAANGALREHFQKMANKYRKNVFFAERKYCTDNAAMIAAAGAGRMMSKNDGIGDFLDLNAYAQVPLGS